MKSVLYCTFALTLLLACSRNLHAEESVPLQRDWMINLVDGMGWTFGLPDEPQDADYLEILEGRRRYRIEAEQARRPTDMVSAKDFTSFGEFSGEGWLSGIATPTTAHLDFHLPIAGRYRVSTSLLQPGFKISIGGHSFQADGGKAFEPVELGAVDLPAGALEIIVELPPNGGIDYLELQAPNLRPVAPLQGWNPGAALGREDLAVTVARLLDLEPALPPAGLPLIIEAETAGPFSGVEITDIRRMGEPSGGRWIRSGNLPAEVFFAFEVPAAGVYSLALRGTALSEQTARLNERFEFTLNFPSYLGAVEVGDFYLPRGLNTLQITLPPRAGLDSLSLQPHGSRPDNYLRLAGLQELSDPPTIAEMNRLLALLAALGPAR
ncbi:hypothetical protein DESUT3_16690 [Desulfuromonas versatilis]|uniref:Uncharacterized protein n=1 Tax=Desulfuromonas versatilis TaxID=2802975 RepID=A0ABM8HVQ2_9BACT|nr:hypothetical protein [Desulfuromonas versatilis]BCR04600.1 hypothetical protein DESUT3_16690 [Desulfuromonas versatilis]